MSQKRDIVCVYVSVLVDLYESLEPTIPEQ